MLLQSVFAIASGGVVGLLLGATGGGGMLVAIPLLVYVVGVPVQKATAMSLVVVGYSALFGAWQESRHDRVRGLAALFFSSTGMIGAWIGAQGHEWVSGVVFLVWFGVFLMMIGLWTYHRGGVEEAEDGEEGCAQQFSLRCAVKALGIGFGVGLLTGFFGIGGGFVIVPTLMYVMGFPIRMAVGTSFLIVALTSVGGIIGHLKLSDIDSSLTMLVIIGSLVGMVAGARFRKTVQEQSLRKAFAALAGGTGLFLVVDNGIRLMS